MRSMFMKLFFWFWLITVLSGGICFILAFNLRLSPMQARRIHHFDEERRRFASQALTMYGRNAAALRDRGVAIEGAEGFDGDGMRAYLFAADGTPISPGPSPRLVDAVRETAKSDGGDVAPRRDDIVVVRVASPSGTTFLAAAEKVTHVPPGPLGGFPLPPDFWLNMLITLLVSGCACYGLAWGLTTPIRRLRAATQSFAGGDLGARVELGNAAAGDELADLGRDFNRMAERIEKLVNSHRQLLRDVSHELRSPLARLGVALGLARKSAPAVASLDRIEQEADRLNLLIGELLTLSQIEGGSGTTSFGRVDLAELVQEVVRDADFEANASRRSVQSACMQAVMLHGNREMLRRALENVVRNAVRYTEEESSVEVRLEPSGPERAVIRVRDHGPGVPDAQLEAIFRPFYRVGEARDRESGGSGIGLAIASETVVMHGGGISARNADGGGLEVELILPLN
ncbi:HAMP domain-containing protein [Geomonas oryzisoli]|uniref:histidine kinase n=1 Tax=Geomonas oryzisoli TaxID=2847992 RepID=A0ABX8J9F8_9BACT|nr:ATP-binding protein [Geomonas oryzisoli]QWV94641.1 HAMP domain-containing protein [Geomonas oryzisoli]